MARWKRAIKYCPACRDKANAAVRKVAIKLWVEKNKDHCEDLHRRYFKKRWKDPKFREYRRLKLREWKKRNRRQYLELAKRDRQKHHKRVMGHNRKRLLLKRNVVGSHTTKQWEELKRKYLFRCACCKKQKTLTRDHIIPLSLGGSDFIDNIQPLCQSCNSKKYTKEEKYV